MVEDHAVNFEDRRTGAKTVSTFLGRNGGGKCKGVDVHKYAALGVCDEITLTPVTSKGLLANCNICIPRQFVHEFIGLLAIESELPLIGTVNVIEQVGISVARLAAFPDNEQGGRLAEKTFIKWARALKFSDKDIEFGLEEGTLELGEKKVIIVHSTEANEGE